MPLMKLTTNPIMEMPDKSVILNICEKVLGSLCIAIMIFIMNDKVNLFSLNSKQEILLFTIAIVVLIMNFVGWSLYFNGHQSMAIMIGFLAVLPPLYYVFIGLWRSNTALVITSFLFLVTHITNVWNNLKF